MLTEATVLEVDRLLSQDQLSQRQIAKQVGVSRGSVQRVANGLLSVDRSGNRVETDHPDAYLPTPDEIVAKTAEIRKARQAQPKKTRGRRPGHKDTHTGAYILARRKVTRIKLMLCRGMSVKAVRRRIRVSKCSITSIAEGVFYCGHRRSGAYNPTQQELLSYREEFRSRPENAPKPMTVKKRDMTKEDICNVEPISDAELQELLETSVKWAVK